MAGVIRQYRKTEDAQLSQHFRLREFHCHCVYPECEYTYLSETLVEGLQQLRLAVGPIVINSGYRCPHHNSDVNGKPHSTHTIGIAADIRHKILTTDEVAKAAKSIEVFKNGGIGLYPGWIHLDVRGTAARW